MVKADIFKQNDLRHQLQKYGALGVLVMILILNIIITPNFLNLGTIWNIVIQSCTILLTSMGMTMVISSGGIDISVGSLMAVSSMVAAKMLPYGVGAAFISGLVCCALFGLLSGFMIGKLNIQPMIMTLTLLMVARGAAQVMNNAMIEYIQDTGFKVIGTYKIFGQIPVQILVILLVVGLVYFVMEKSAFGRYVQSVGDNKNSARLAGINTAGTIMMVYMCSAILAGAAGIIETAKIGAADGNSIGKLAELDAIAAVAVGGTSMSGGRAKVIGTVIGALIMQLITITVNMNNIPYEFAQVSKSVIIILAVFLQREKNS